MRSSFLQSSISRRLGLTLVALIAVGFLVSIMPPVHGDDDPKREAYQAAHDLLMKAHDESDPQQRIAELKSARTAIKGALPGAPGPHRQSALDDVNAAIRQVKLGDPESEANRYIENANRQIGY
jgi:hypothetical protein